MKSMIKIKMLMLLCVFTISAFSCRETAKNENEHDEHMENTEHMEDSEHMEGSEHMMDEEHTNESHEHDDDLEHH